MKNFSFFFSSRYIVDTTVDNDSANSRDALLEEPKPTVNRRFSNTSQSSWDLSDGERRKEKRKEKSKQQHQQQQQVDEPTNSGSIVGIDWLFENGEGEPWTNKSESFFFSRIIRQQCGVAIGCIRKSAGNRLEIFWNTFFSNSSRWPEKQFFLVFYA